MLAGFSSVVQPSPAGRGGEGRCGCCSSLCFQKALLRRALACRGGEGGSSWRAWLLSDGSGKEEIVLRAGLSEDGWMQGGSAMAVRVHRARFRCMRRTAHAVFYKSGGALSSGRGGGLVASSPVTKRLLAGDAAVQRPWFQVLRVLGSVADRKSGV